MTGWRPSNTISFRYINEDRGFGTPFTVSKGATPGSEFTVTLAALIRVGDTYQPVAYTITGGDTVNYKVRVYLCHTSFISPGGNEIGATGIFGDLGYDGSAGNLSWAGGAFPDVDPGGFFYNVAVIQPSNGSIGAFVAVGTPATALTGTLTADEVTRRDDLPPESNLGFYATVDPPIPKSLSEAPPAHAIDVAVGGSIFTFHTIDLLVTGGLTMVYSLAPTITSGGIVFFIVNSLGNPILGTSAVDLYLAADHTIINIPEINAGVFYGYGVWYQDTFGTLTPIATVERSRVPGSEAVDPGFTVVKLLTRASAEVNQTGSPLDISDWDGDDNYAEHGWVSVPWQQEGGVAYANSIRLPSVTIQTLEDDPSIDPGALDPDLHITWLNPPTRPPFAIATQAARGRFARPPRTV